MMETQMLNPVMKEESAPIKIIMKKKKQKQKVLVLDSGTIINLAMNGLLYIFEELKKISEVKFILTQEVKNETVDRPINIPRFELEALRIKSLIDNKIIESPSSLGIQEEEIRDLTKHLMETANHSVQLKGEWIKIVSDAEMSCLALSRILTERGVENIIAIDERTTRILAEKPENLEKIMSGKMHANVKIESGNFRNFSEFRFIRSTELVYVAYKKGLLKIKGSNALEAALYATKYKGSSVSFDEINVLKKL